MPSVEPLFELQSNAPGLPGPYLVENLAPYHIFDEMDQVKPKIILAIGGMCKRQYMSSSYLVRGHPKEHCIAVADIGDDTLILDGELHLKDHDSLPRFQEKRPIGGGYRAHTLEKEVFRTGTVASQIYAGVLSLFSDLVVIFIPDFGLAPALELLCFWMKSAMMSECHLTSRVVLLHDNIPPTMEIDNRLMASLASELRRTDPLRSYTNANVREIMENTFCITNVSLADFTWWKHVDEALMIARAERVDKGMGLTANNIKHLLQNAIKQHVQTPTILKACIVKLRFVAFCKAINQLAMQKSGFSRQLYISMQAPLECPGFLQNAFSEVFIVN
ncbi:uncharacterized protein FTOL_06877 [Fusarium torulosum]|uniref:Uncharacterized protein n=1 Tax=Fusarium torulosum TaxID=33205 RepID=A0AAE8SII0_9HYPO|nr:uncharacterized protein FTOL_06877 [Fusarium torulosum]